MYKYKSINITDFMGCICYLIEPSPTINYGVVELEAGIISLEIYHLCWTFEAKSKSATESIQIELASVFHQLANAKVDAKNLTYAWLTPTWILAYISY